MSYTIVLKYIYVSPSKPNPPYTNEISAGPKLLPNIKLTKILAIGLIKGRINFNIKIIKLI